MHITKRSGESAGSRWFALTGLAVAIMGLNAHAQASAIGQEAQGQAVSSVTQSRNFDIAAQPLDSAIIEFSRQSDVVVTAPSHLLAGKFAPAVRGSYSVMEALRMLLADSGLHSRQVGQDSFVIERPPAEGGPKNGENVAALDAVMVFGSLQDQLSVGSKSGQTLRETPKSVTLVTRERIEAQNLSSLAEALNQTTGVIVTSHSPSAVDSFFYSRGFRVQTLQMDGGAPAFTGGSGMFLAPDTAAYDHIEMLRGVDGMFTGAGQPGGTVNLVRKRAQAGREVQLA